ncbi:MAG: conjugal transfer nickase/helicase domain-containing protein [Thalassospira sp.]|uniref:conjugal transfer nickase/helicase domain-containing protein n=1 Tax=Thalassospira sp. TaxID=1912094 RepID=UPI003A880377
MSWWGSQQDTEIDRARPEHDPLHDVWKLTALPRSEFDSTYVDLWTRTTSVVDRDPAVDTETFNTELMTSTRATMRVRQSQILPRRIATEEATRLSELMTFVVAFALVLYRVRDMDSVGKPLLDWGLDTLLCDTSCRWILDEPVAYEELQRFCDGDGDSEIRALIELAESRLSTLRAPAPVAAASAVKPNQMPVNARKAKGWRFVAWLRAELEAGHLTVNEPSSLVHTLPGGEAFLVVPVLFEQFAQIEGEPAKRIQNQVARLGLHRVVEGHNLFTANLNGKTVRGLILGTGAGLWTHVPAPNHVLRMRGSCAS